MSYVPADSDSGMFGGNSNWRGPVWMPVNFLLYNSLLRMGAYYGDSFKVECPTGSGRLLNLAEVAHELATRLIGTFERNAEGLRPVFGGSDKFQNDPHWRDNILFYEYFHGDNGAGVGASHQTGWTGVIARSMHLFATTTADQVIELGKVAGVVEIDKPAPKEPVAHELRSGKKGIEVTQTKTTVSPSRRSSTQGDEKNLPRSKRL